MTRRLLVALLVLAACKGKSQDANKEKVDTGSANVPPHPMPDPPPAVVPGDWAVCKAALEASPKTPPTKQVAALIEGCKPCGDWTPLLQWSTPTEDGGPKRKDIEERMVGCKAYCDPNAKMRFQGALDDNRGKTNRLPWRVLGDFCKDALSAVPDARFMSAPYFALDRIARDVATRPEGAKLLAAIDLVLPAVSVTGAGLVLPTTAVTKPTAAPSQLTITADELRIGPLPHAKLGATGVIVTPATDLYPGAVVKLADLPAALDKLPQPVLVFAPPKLPAARLAEVLAVTKRRPLLLAVAASSALPGWEVYGVSPVEIVGEVEAARLAQDKTLRMTLAIGDQTDAAVKEIARATPANAAIPPALELQASATVQSVATVLGALAYKDVATAVVTIAKRSKP